MVTFSWTLPYPTTQHFDHYDIEVLKVEPLYDINTFSTTNSCQVPLDWSKASTIEVEGGVTSYSMSLTEGTGYYFGA